MSPPPEPRSEYLRPGVSWVGSEERFHEAGRLMCGAVSYQHRYRCRAHLNVTDGAALGDWGSYTTDSNTPRSLYKTITTDEHDKQVIAFKDKEGKVILKKVRLMRR